MESIILAGGLGTRLAAQLHNIPKPMAPVAGRPFLEILLNQLSRSGCNRVILSVGYLHQTIQQRFGASYRGMTLDYAIEDTPLGTGGALRAALQKTSTQHVLALNGDTYLYADYAGMMRFHLAERASLTIAITPQANVARYGGILTKDRRVIGFEEKGRSGPGWINAGAYIFGPDLRWPPGLPASFSFETDVLMRTAGYIQPAAFEVDGFFLDIGVPEDLDRAQIELADVER